ncbi:ABC transporter ATP-binding protein [Sediminibacterium soli]|uniref:ABC transporter ATP-binding protein n=1 Tax=Sediminibacterium soli TaxID=2698829 RepID=UPI00137A20C3|nr:ABC transporter ATP-binding protein [Sediminibacterium soli]NCI47323.1 ABC transporter ATP-binding protein [Sediminibacterium soli]
MKTFFRLLTFSKPYYHYVPEYVIYILLYIIFGLLNFALLIPLLDVLFETKPAVVVTTAPDFSLSVDFFKNYFYYYTTNYSRTPEGKFTILMYVCVILFICVLLKNLFGFLGQKVLTRMRVNLLKRLRGDIFEQLATQSLGFYHNEKKGDLMSIISNDIVEIENSVVSAIQTVFREPLTIIATFVMLFYLSPQLTLFTIVFFPLSGFIISSISRRLRKKAGRSQQLSGELLSMTDEAIGGIRIIKSFNAEKIVTEKYRSANNKLTRLLKSIVNQRELASPLSEVLGVLVIVVIILYGGSLILHDKSNLTASAFIAYVAFYFQIITPAKNTANAITTLQRGLSAGERVLRVIDAPKTILEKPDAISKHSFDSSLDFADTSFAYSENEVLSHIHIHIPKGKTIALVGESGAGKSTMADLVPRFYDVTGGSIRIDGTDIRDIKIKDLRSLISVVSQEAILFNDTVLNNICFGNETADRDAAIHAAKVANAHEFILQLEQGYDTVIGDRGMRLSGGQRQRLTIARAIYKNAPILILDEATSALDTESERLVQDAINRLLVNRTSIIIAHRLSTIRHADEIVVLQKGQIAERGSHEELLQKNGIYRRLIEMQEVK